MAEVGVAYVTLSVSAKGIGQGINQELGGIANQAQGVGDQAGSKMGGGILSGIKKFIGPIIATLATVGISNFIKDAVTAASDLEETGAAVSQVFGSAADQLKTLAQSAPTTFGQTQEQFLNAAKTFGIFGQAAGLAADENVAFSAELVSLATDLASFNNTDVDTAIQALGAGLRGESEPLRQFGVLLDDATLKARAMEMGIFDGTGSLTQQQRVLAAQAEILAQTSTQQGDFARTSDGLANSQRILSASFEQMKATVGTALVPAFALVAQSLVPIIEELAPMLAEAFTALVPVVTELAGVIPSLLDVFAPLIPLIGEILGTIGGLVVAFMPLFITLLEVLVRVVAALLPPFLSLLEGILLPLVPMIAQLQEAFMPLIDQVLPVIVDLINQLVPIFIDFLMGVITPLVPMVMALVEAFIPIVTKIFPMLAELLLTVIPLFLSLAEQVIMPLLPIVLDLVMAFMPLISQILPILIQILMTMLPIWMQLLQIILIPLIPIIQFLAQVVIFLVEMALNILVWILETLVLPAFGALSYFLDVVLPPIIESVTGFFEDMGTKFEEVSGWIEDAWENVGSFFTSVANGMIGAFESFVNFVIDGINGFLGALDDVGQGIQDLTGGAFGFDVTARLQRVSIPRLAEGGFITRPTMALVGEAGPEVVTPLKDFERMMGLDSTGSGINLTYNAAPNQSLSSEQALIEAIRKTRLVFNWSV